VALMNSQQILVQSMPMVESLALMMAAESSTSKAKVLSKIKTLKKKKKPLLKAVIFSVQLLMLLLAAFAKPQIMEN
jgi:hypothetical protein